jgi:hypothetical protein
MASQRPDLLEYSIHTLTSRTSLDTAFQRKLVQVRLRNSTSLPADIHLVFSSGAGVERKIVRWRDSPEAVAVAVETEGKVL